jgi:hypothetical protein
MSRSDDGHRPRHRSPDVVEELPASGASTAWNLPDDIQEDTNDGARPIATLVSFHYLRAAIRRRRRLCVFSGTVGVLLAVVFLVTHPSASSATTTLRLIHEAQADPSGAIATDISLVKTRTVAERTIAALRLPLTPDDVMNAVNAVPTGSSEILRLTMSAPTDAEAIRRLRQFSQEYLDFRATQVSAQSDVIIHGYEKEIASLQAQADSLRRQVDQLANDSVASDRLTEAVTKLSQINSKIGSLQGTVDDATLQQQAIMSASRVIDPVAAASTAGLRRTILVLSSGLIGGTALGFAVIVLGAILSDRLWLRTEVATALTTPVRLSVRRMAPLPRPFQALRHVPFLRGRDLRSALDRQRMALAIAKELPQPGHRQCLAVVCLDNSDDMRFGMVAAALSIHGRDRMVTVVDLTDAGTVASSAARLIGATTEGTPSVLRPSVVPSVAESPAHIDASGWEDVASANAKNRVNLVIADLDPAIGVDHLTAWTDAVLVAVTAGHSSVELVRTAGELVRSVGLELRGALLLGAEVQDDSSGVMATRTDASETPVERHGPIVGRSS